MEEKLAKVLELLKNCRLYGLQSQCYSFWDSAENTRKVDKLLKELEEEGDL